LRSGKRINSPRSVPAAFTAPMGGVLQIDKRAN